MYKLNNPKKRSLESYYSTFPINGHNISDTSPPSPKQNKNILNKFHSVAQYIHISRVVINLKDFNDWATKRTFWTKKLLSKQKST